MMHKWESTEKLLPQWENQPIGGTPFLYEDFSFKDDEFDNVPPVVPRFLFYLQNNLKPVADLCKQLTEAQSVSGLRDEVKDWVVDLKNDIKNMDDQSKQRDSDLTTKFKDLQHQIDTINEQILSKEVEQKRLASQTLWDKEAFNFESERVKDQLETKKAGYSQNLDNDYFKQPRMFSLQQLRNSFFALIHQSQTKAQIEDLESKQVVLIRGQEALERTDEALGFKIKQSAENIRLDISEFREDFTQTQRLNEKTFGTLKSQVQQNDQKIFQHSEKLAEHKLKIDHVASDIQKSMNRVEQFRKDLQVETTNVKDELVYKIDSIEAFCLSNFELIKESTNKDRSVFQNAMSALKDELSNNMQKEADSLSKYVVEVTKKGSAHRDNLQEKYDEKIERIKDVCASYFSKYEQHLLQQQELMKTLEKRQEDWINQLLKPQELNQARLFAMDSRFDESEKARLEDCQFHKDNLKKLIFAMEQHLQTARQVNDKSGASVDRNLSANNSNVSPPRSSPGMLRHSSSARGGLRTMRNLHQRGEGGLRSGMTAPLLRKSVADNNFTLPISNNSQSNYQSNYQSNNQLVPYQENEQNNQLLPQLQTLDNNHNYNLKNQKGSARLNSQNGSDARQNQQYQSNADQTTAANSGPQNSNNNGLSTNDMLFFKRLLFLKATLDNQQLV